MDMGAPYLEQQVDRHGRIHSGHPRLPGLSMRSQDVDARDKPGHDAQTTEVSMKRQSIYFFAGAILESAGLAGIRLGVGFAASSGLSMRSTLAASRSLAT